MTRGSLGLTAGLGEARAKVKGRGGSYDLPPNSFPWTSLWKQIAKSKIGKGVGSRLEAVYTFGLA